MGHWTPLAGVAGTIAAMHTQIQTLNVPNVHYAPWSSNPNEWVGGWGGSIANKITEPTNTVLTRLNALTTGVSMLSSIRSRVLAAVHDFAVRQYHALTFENVAETIFESHRAAIDRVLAEAAPEVLEKLPTIMDRIAERDPEAVSQAMNSVRRMIKSLADRAYPANTESVVVDGESYDVGSDKVLIRLKLVLIEKCSSKSRRERLTRSVRDIHERASAGAHADITHPEARALVLAAYLTLGEIVRPVYRHSMAAVSRQKTGPVHGRRTRPDHRVVRQERLFLLSVNRLAVFQRYETVRDLCLDLARCKP